MLLIIISMASVGDYRIPLEDQDRYILSQRMAYLEDSTNSLTINDVTILDRSQWTMPTDARSSFGYSKSSYWVHVSFLVKHSALWYVWLRYAPLDYVTFYWTQNGKLLDAYESGDAIPFSVRQVHIPENASFRFLEKGEKIDVYIRIHTEGSYRIPLEIHQSQHFESDTAELLVFQGIYYGVLIVMSIFNLVLYFITGIRSYLHYVFYVATSLGSRLAIDGTGFQFLWANSPVINQWGVPITFWLSSMAFLLFSYTFLTINNAGIKTRFYFKLLAILGLLIGLGLPFLSYNQFVPLVILYATLLMFSSLISSIILTLLGYQYAGIFAIATMMTAVAFGITVVESLGYYSDQTFMIYSYPIARMFEIVLFAIALGVRIRFLQNKRISAEKEMILHRENSIQSIEQYKRLYESAMTGNFVLDVEGNVKSANTAFYELLGNERNHNVKMYFDLDISMIFKKGVESEAFKITKEIMGKNGKWFLVNIYKVEIDNVIQFEGSLIDVTDRIEAEKSRADSEKNKMQALQQLVVGVAHEINTPLGVVRTSCDFARESILKMQSSVERNELTKGNLIECLSSSEEALKISETSCLRMAELIQSFKRVSVEQMSFVIEPLNLLELTRRLKVSAAQYSVPISINITNSTANEFHTFSEGIYWVLNELLKNSCEHAKSETGVFVEFELNNQSLHIHFYDQGLGVKGENIDLIFDPFFTTGRGVDRKLGLGLYQTKNIIVQLLHGTVEVHNINGLNFEITIPLLLAEST